MGVPDEITRRITWVPDEEGLKLPGLDGYQVCQRLKGDPTTSTIPIIMITAFLTGPSDTVRGIEYGADDYLNKPVDLDVLAARVRMILRRVQR